MEEITAEYSVESIAAPIELRVRPKITVGAKTDLGRVRENNEDKHEFYLTESDAELASRGHVLIVCDGMGGHAAGQFASELSVKTFIDVYRSHPAQQPEEAAQAAVVAANRFVLDVARAIPSRRGMGTTLSALMIVQDSGIIAHVGDSRIYRLRDGEITQLTRDHTWVEEMVAMGALSREDAENHQNRHMILRAIGADLEVNPDVSRIDLQEGDIYMLCSDGLTNHVSDEEIQAVLASESPSQAAWTLVGKALVGGGSDNTTAIVARIDSLESLS